ncbi:hypothetical protein [Natranaerobius trueperi]|uniref:Uncharacterized protein n=1 Tax=Natranaerobius trueperi TaxID=759412 RepID=A0A226C3B4_9FIRM|nr:hypothetical protein [Natranaerobius trueperi]OWZ84900.1 hypothetical protein CDO51_00390 [Natranaerobius trueperi]
MLQKINWVIFLVAFGGVLSLTVTVARYFQGTNLGLSLITTGLLLPFSLLNYFIDYNYMISLLRSHVKVTSQKTLLREISILIIYLGVLVTLGYGFINNFSFILFWLVVIVPGSSFFVTKILRNYM